MPGLLPAPALACASGYYNPVWDGPPKCQHWQRYYSLAQPSPLPVPALTSGWSSLTQRGPPQHLCAPAGVYWPGLLPAPAPVSIRRVLGRGVLWPNLAKAHHHPQLSMRTRGCCCPAEGSPQVPCWTCTQSQVCCPGGWCDPAWCGLPPPQYSL